jgi:hypothetical protein
VCVCVCVCVYVCVRERDRQTERQRTQENKSDMFDFKFWIQFILVLVTFCELPTVKKYAYDGYLCSLGAVNKRKVHKTDA